MNVQKWVFQLGFTALVLGGCGGSTTDPVARKANAATGQPDGGAVFRQYCITCHGADGTLGLNGAKDLTKSTLTLEERINIITHGKKLMTPFEELLSPAEIQAVANYTLTLKQ